MIRFVPGVSYEVYLHDALGYILLAKKNIIMADDCLCGPDSSCDFFMDLVDDLNGIFTKLNKIIDDSYGVED